MRIISLIVAACIALPLASARPQGHTHTHDDEPTIIVTSTTSTSSTSSTSHTHDHGATTTVSTTSSSTHTHDHGATSTTSGGVQPSSSAPAGCKLNAADTGLTAEAWQAALPGVEIPEPYLDHKRPDYVYYASTVAQVQAAVKFATSKNIRLSVLNSGHDFLGRNDAPAGLSLDISGLQGIRLSQLYIPTFNGVDNIDPSKEPNVINPLLLLQPVVTFGAGVTTQQLTDALDKSKLTAVGAAHGTVRTAGGWGQAAGHGALSAYFGLGVDQALEYKVVTADGQLRVANSLTNTDLFWALRGGGGGTFGIVVEATIKIHPTPKITVTNWWINATDPANPGDGFWNAAAYLHTQFKQLSEKGVQGYYYTYPNAILGLMLTPGEYSGTAKAEAAWKPVLDKMATFPGMKPATMKFYEYPSYKAFFDMRFGPICPEMEEEPHRLFRRHEGMLAPQGILPMDSRLLGASHMASPNLAQALKDAYPRVPQGILRGHLIGGGKVLSSRENTSVLPAWRKAYVHLIATGTGMDFRVDSLRALAPDMGAYVNEAHLKNPNWKTDFWGSNYARLSQIKTKYDPNGVFWVTPGINADLYEVRDNRVCKLANVLESTYAPETDNHNIGIRNLEAYDTLSGFPNVTAINPHQGTCEVDGGHDHRKLF